MSSHEDEDDDEYDDEDNDDDDDIELSLERIEQSTEDEDEEDNESNILSTNVDSPSNSLVIELWSCHCSSDTILPVVSLFSLRSNNSTTRTSQ